MYDLMYMKHKNRQEMEIKAHASGMGGGGAWKRADETCWDGGNALCPHWL